jgi:hypothetical protein
MKECIEDTQCGPDLVASYGLYSDQNIINIPSNASEIDFVTGKLEPIFNTCTRIKFDDKFVNQPHIIRKESAKGCQCRHNTCVYPFDELEHGYKILQEGVYQISANINLTLDLNIHKSGSGGGNESESGGNLRKIKKDKENGNIGVNTDNAIIASVTISKLSCSEGAITALQQRIVYSNGETSLNFDNGDIAFERLVFNNVDFNFRVETGCDEKNVAVGDVIVVSVSLINVPPDFILSTTPLKLYVTGERSSCGGYAPTSMFNAERISRVKKCRDKLVCCE